MTAVCWGALFPPPFLMSAEYSGESGSSVRTISVIIFSLYIHFGDFPGCGAQNVVAEEAVNSGDGPYKKG